MLQLREANVTTRLYSPASTAAVDLQLSYYHRVSMARVYITPFPDMLGDRKSMAGAQAAHSSLCVCVTYASWALTPVPKGFLLPCQTRYSSVDYHTVVRYALVDAATEPYATNRKVSRCMVSWELVERPVKAACMQRIDVW